MRDRVGVHEVSDIEVIPGGIRVRPKDGRFKVVPTPSGYTQETFRAAVSAFDSAFRTNGTIPTVDEVHEFWPRIPRSTYATLLGTKEFREALEYRGISLDENAGLSMEQAALLMKLVDFTDKRSLGVKLKELGIPMSRYQAWMQQPLFRASYFKRTEELFKDAVPLALNRLVANVDAGDQRAIEKVLEITGRWNPNQQQVEDVKKVVVGLVEAVVRHVTDAETRKAIMEDVYSQVSSYTLIEQSQLPRG